MIRFARASSRIDIALLSNVENLVFSTESSLLSNNLALGGLLGLLVPDVDVPLGAVCRKE